MNAIAKDSVIANLEFWIAALRSGHYKQGRRRLRQGDAFCCLGVACDLMNPTAWEEDTYHDLIWRTGIGSCLETSLDTGVSDGFGLSQGDQCALINLNDTESKSFSEIADYIEQTILPRVRSRQEASA